MADTRAYSFHSQHQRRHHLLLYLPRNWKTSTRTLTQFRMPSPSPASALAPSSAITYCKGNWERLLHFSLLPGSRIWSVQSLGAESTRGRLTPPHLARQIDGWLARKYDMGSVLGSILDPAADKLLMTTMVVTLAMKSMLPRSLDPSSGFGAVANLVILAHSSPSCSHHWARCCTRHLCLLLPLCLAPTASEPILGSVVAVPADADQRERSHRKLSSDIGTSRSPLLKSSPPCCRSTILRFSLCWSAPRLSLHFFLMTSPCLSSAYSELHSDLKMTTSGSLTSNFRRWLVAGTTLGSSVAYLRGSGVRYVK